MLFSQVWIWSKAKFVNRKFLMEEVYQQTQAEHRTDDVKNITYVFKNVFYCN